jgi:broad specificity phosphatase PhoE
MEIIEIDGYTEHEKVQIAQQYLVPRQIKENGLHEDEVAFAEEALRRIIHEYSYESGVRNLERQIGAVCRKVTTHVAEDRSGFARTVVDSLEGLIERHRGHKIAVVCHGGVINMWAAEVLGLQPEMFFEPFYTSVNRFMAASSGERSVVSLNEVAHLRGIE